MNLGNTNLAPTLVIVGGSVRAAAWSAFRAGFAPWGADRYHDSDLAAVARILPVRNFPRGLTSLFEEDSPLLRELDLMGKSSAIDSDFLQPRAWMYTGGIENHPRLVERLEAAGSRHGFKLWGNTGTTLRNARNPWKIVAALQRAKLPFPAIKNYNDPPPPDGNWLLKRRRGTGGLGVRRWVHHSEFPKRGDYFQRRIDGVSCGAIFVASSLLPNKHNGIDKDSSIMNQGRCHLLGVTRQLIGERSLSASGYLYSGSVGPWPLSESSRRQVSLLGTTVASEFGLRGLFGIDFILDESGSPWLVEINPRYTASCEVLERATDESLIAKHADCFVDNRSLSKPAVPTVGVEQSSQEAGASKRGMIGKGILFARVDLWIDRDVPFRNLFPTELPFELADIPAAGTSIRRGMPICTVFVDGNGWDDCRKQLACSARGIYETLAARARDVNRLR